jgi:glyoxylase-like metal-dependent hydrolase (beta-lactamase superfamily II)
MCDAGYHGAMRELRAGLWHWQAPHPEWTPKERWPQMVSSCAIDDGERLLLFDPLAVPDELLERAGERETAVVLTAPWHERDTRTLVERLGVPVYSPPPDTADDLMRKYRIPRELAGDGSPDLNWLRAGGGDARWYAAGDRLPGGIEAHAGREHNDLVLWVERLGALIAGDTLVDFGGGFEVNPWPHGSLTREQTAEALRPLLSLPVEVVLPPHGAPTDRAALERAIG